MTRMQRHDTEALVTPNVIINYNKRSHCKYWPMTNPSNGPIRERKLAISFLGSWPRYTEPQLVRSSMHTVKIYSDNSALKSPSNNAEAFCFFLELSSNTFSSQSHLILLPLLSFCLSSQLFHSFSAHFSCIVNPSCNQEAHLGGLSW